MSPIYWIEDEPDVLSYFCLLVRKKGLRIVKIGDASECLERVAEIRQRPGPIVLDLYLPRGDEKASHQIPKDISGPQIGLWLLGELQKTLGETARIAILSGNLSVDVSERLGDEFKVSNEWIFAKPLLDPESLAELLSDWAREETATATKEGSKP